MRTNKKRVASSSVLTLTILSLAVFNGCTPSGPRAVLDGARLVREGRPDQGAVRLEEGVRQLPGNAQAWNYLGLAYHQLGRHADAARAYQQALTLDRNLSAARFNLGCLNLDQGNAAGAVSEFTTFTVLQPGSAAGWTKLGTAQLRARQLDSAERSFAQALKLDAASPEAWNGSGLTLVQRRRYADALNHFNAALKVKPDYAPALLNAGIVAQQNLNNRPAALQRFRAYLAVKPPPPNSAAVLQIADQLDSELHPPVRPANTNTPVTLASVPPRSDATTAAPKPLAVSVTNRPVTSTPVPAPEIPAASNTTPAANAAPAVSSTPPSRATPTNTVPTNPPPSVVTSAPAVVEVVQIPKEDPIQPIRDVPTAPLDRTATANVARPGPAQSPASPPEVTGLATNTSAVQPAAAKAKPKQPLIKKLNPANWFRSKRTDVDTDSRQEPPATEATTTRQVTKAPEVARIPSVSSGPGTTEEAPPTTNVPAATRAPVYTYHSYGIPPSGNRGEAERWSTTGVRARERNRLAEAVDAFRKAVAADPSFFEAHYNLGVVEFESGAYGKALPAYEQALAINPDSMKARYNFAVTLQKAGFPLDAARELERVLEKNPAEAVAHLELANLYAGPLADPTRARRHYATFLTLQPQSPQAAAVRYWLETHP